MKAIWLALAVSTTVSCAGSSGQSIIKFTSHPNVDTAPVAPRERLELSRPTAGLFIGISTYGDAAMVQSLPAHALGAATMYVPFRQAAEYPNTRAQHSLRLVAEYTRAPLCELEHQGLLDDPVATRLKHLGIPRDAVQVIAPRVDTCRDRVYAEGEKDPDSLVEAYPSPLPLVHAARVESELDDLLERAALLEDWYGSVLVVFYLAAHGVTAASGEEFVIPADGVSGKPETFIPKSRLIARVARFQAARPDTRQSLMIFDTCRNGAFWKTAPLEIPPGMLLVQSTAPGHYAFHGSLHAEFGTRTETTVEGTCDPSLGPCREPAGTTTSEDIARVDTHVSVFPIAATDALSRLAPPSGTGTSPLGFISAQVWLDTAQAQLQRWLSTLKNAERQSIRYEGALPGRGDVFYLHPEPAWARFPGQEKAPSPSAFRSLPTCGSQITDGQPAATPLEVQGWRDKVPTVPSSPPEALTTFLATLYLPTEIEGGDRSWMQYGFCPTFVIGGRAHAGAVGFSGLHLDEDHSPASGEFPDPEALPRSLSLGDTLRARIRLRAPAVLAPGQTFDVLNGDRRVAHGIVTVAHEEKCPPPPLFPPQHEDRGLRLCP